MSDLKSRPFSKNYSGLINQSVIAICIAILCVGAQEVMKRRRRGKHQDQNGLGIVGSHGNLDRPVMGKVNKVVFPSPSAPTGWPLAWVKEVIRFPEDKMNELRGIDATLYVRFLRGAFWFATLQTVTIFPILFPIHVRFADKTIPTKSMTRASIASLVSTEKGLSLLWIHICLLFWVTLTWMGTLVWIISGAFRLRTANIQATAERIANQEDKEEADQTIYPHPHPGYSFQEIPSLQPGHPNKGLRHRTIMVTNVPQGLRNEKELKEYFEYYMSRKLEKPSMGLTSSTQPGFLNKCTAFILNRAKKIPANLPINPLSSRASEDKDKSKADRGVPAIERVVIARKMTELASLLYRREDILRLLETAHIKLANKALHAVKLAIDRTNANKPVGPVTSRAAGILKKRRTVDSETGAPDVELGEPQEGSLSEEERMNQLIDVLGPYVHEFGCRRSLGERSKKAISRGSRQLFGKLHDHGGRDSTNEIPSSNILPVETTTPSEKTIWDALLSLPRSSLDPYQPLINLSHLFRGKIVPAIDYYTAKLNLLTAMITENRAKALADYDPVSTAFVTFADPADARRACKYLAVHPNNPLECFVTMAPAYQDLDWIRVMKSSFNVEFVKDWVVDIGVWAFTLFWIFPVTLLVGLVSIQNISLFWPSLKSYLDKHQWESEVIQSFLPTILVALLALLIPLILLLIAKKAHTITTFSALHDRIMTRYYKFLIVNVLVFFCVGTTALQSILNSFKVNSGSRPDILNVVSDTFPTAGPFYVGWLIFTTAMHGCFELALLGLPLILYPSTSRQVTPRKRALGTRPRTLNYYYWLPNHLLVIHVILLLCILNPFVLPFATIYFFVQSGVIKNQLIHVYAKQYEGNGHNLLIRIVRYSLDGVVLAQAVFLVYMIVLKKSANVGLSAFLIVFTIAVKLIMTRMCRAQFERNDIAEAEILCGLRPSAPMITSEPYPESDTSTNDSHEDNALIESQRRSLLGTWRLPDWINFSYGTIRHHPKFPRRRHPNPFGHTSQSFTRLQSISRDAKHSHQMAEVNGQSSPKALNSNPIVEQPRETVKRPLILEPMSARGTVRNYSSNNGPCSNPVVPHPPPATWDDQGTPDFPYDNPYYTRVIDNVLWLPRDPTGTLNLEDTVDLKVSVTVETAKGSLGTWFGLPETTTPEELSRIPSHGSNANELVQSPGFPFAQEPLLEVDGTEEIDLPLVIAKRAQSGGDEIEPAVRPRRPSAYRSKVSLAERSTISLSSGRRRRPSVLEAPLNSYRSFSDKTPSRGRSASIMSTLQPVPRIPRSRSTGHESVPPDTHAQAEFVVANASHISLGMPKLTRAQNLSAGEAIAHEVLEEEREALLTRLTEEKAEADKARTTKSWLTSWMFKKTSS
ncbi:hypothetical protein BDQ17DRAFT_1419404 [Cyathus striatus]|nr:hypothetical protein BDQ17DRAFT_1419404 [Cyathus striatus]